MSSYMVFEDCNNPKVRLQVGRHELGDRPAPSFAVEPADQPLGEFFYLDPDDLPEFVRAVLPPDVLEGIDALLTEAMDRALAKAKGTLREIVLRDEDDDYEGWDEEAWGPIPTQAEEPIPRESWKAKAKEAWAENSELRAEVHRLREAFTASKAERDIPYEGRTAREWREKWLASEAKLGASLRDKNDLENANEKLKRDYDELVAALSGNMGSLENDRNHWREIGTHLIKVLADVKHSLEVDVTLIDGALEATGE